MADDLIQMARAVQDAALATEGVASLGTGRWAEAATYGAGDKVTGVVVSPNEVRVHIVANYPPSEPLQALAERVRERVTSKAGGRPAMVVVEDIEVVQDENL